MDPLKGILRAFEVSHTSISCFLAKGDVNNMYPD